MTDTPKNNVTGKPTRAEEIILAARAIIAAEYKHLRSLETDPNPDDPTTTSRDEADLLLAHLVSEFTVADCDTALRLVRRRSTSPKDLDAALPPKDHVTGSDLRERIFAAISDPGATEGYRGDGDLTEWQTRAVMRVLATTEGQP